MGIAIISPRVTYYRGGAERYILNYLIEASKINKEIYLITFNAPKKSPWFISFEKKFKGKIILVNSKKLSNQFNLFKNAFNPKIWDKESLFFSKDYSPLIQKLKINKLIYHYCVDCLYAPKDKKIFLHLHGLPDQPRNIEKKAIKIPSKIIAVSKYVGKGWKKRYKIKKKIYTIYNAISLKEKIKRSQKNRDIDLFFFGRLIKIKGTETLIKSVYLLKKDFPKIKLLISGKGPEEKKLKKLTKKLNLEKNVIFMELLSDKRLGFFLSKSKIAVFPSYAREGVMTTLLEASYFGCTIIASKSCSNKEYIQDGINGILFKPKSEQDLSRKISYLLNSAQDRKRLVNYNLKKIKDWSFKERAKEILKVYSK